MAMTQTLVMPDWLGLGLNNPPRMPDHHHCRHPDGSAHRRLPGLADRLSDHSGLHRHAGRLFVWRNVAWHLTKGQTIGPLDQNFQLFGGINGTLGETWSWIFAVVAHRWLALRADGARRAKVATSFRSNRCGRKTTHGRDHSGDPRLRRDPQCL
jgi:D-xylose transport system permease protein